MRTAIISERGGDSERRSLLLSSEGDTLPHQSWNRSLLARQREADGAVQTPALNFFQLRFFWRGGGDESERHVIIKANKAPSSSLGERHGAIEIHHCGLNKERLLRFLLGISGKLRRISKNRGKKFGCDQRGEFGNAAGNFIDGSLELIS